MMSTHQKAIDVFISYHENDGALFHELEKHLDILKRQGLISTWHQGQVVPGTHRDTSIGTYLDTASVILLLVSANFLSSDYYSIQMKRALERHAAGEARVVPILVRAVDWQGTPLEHLQALPTGNKPIMSWRSKDLALADITSNLRHMIEDLPLLPASSPRAVLPRVWNIPHRRNPFFTGREGLLDQLQRQLTPIRRNESVKTRSLALTQHQAIKGLGGIGKTQIAVEYAYRSRDLNRYMHTIWVNAASKETIISSFMTIAELLPSFSAKNEMDQQKLVEAVKQWLEQCEYPWLLIFDNVDSDDSLSLLANYFPQQSKGCILFTTRSHAVGSLAISSITVEEMDRWEGTLFLLRRAHLFKHVSIEEASDKEVDMVNAARGIVDALESFPLALEQAGAYIEETESNLTDYLRIYQDHRHDLLARRGRQITNYPDAVATTWSLSFQKVEQANPAAAELLRLCAFLAPDQIPEELIREGADYWSPPLQKAADDLFTFNQMIEELLKFSLVKRLAEDHMLSMHRLVQAVQRDTMQPEVQYQWAERIVFAINKVFPSDARDVKVWPQCRRYLDQVQACYALIKEHMLAFVEAADLLHRTGLYLQQHALYILAESLYQWAVQIWVKQPGPKPSKMASSLNNLAILYTQRGMYVEAEPLYQQALQIWEQQLGPEHPQVAYAINNLAINYSERGMYVEAEPLYQQALQIWGQQLGPEHPQVTYALNGLAIIYSEQEKYAEAELLFLRSLQIKEQQFGPEHLLVTYSLDGLANLYSKQGKYAEAEPLYLRSLQITEEQLGPKHPQLTYSLYALANLYSKQGKYVETELLYQRALQMRKQLLESDHPFTKTIRRDYASFLRAMGHDEKAKEVEENF